MQVYYVTRPLTLLACGQSHTLRAASQSASPALSELYVAAHKELELVQRALQQSYPQHAHEPMLQLLAPQSLAAWPGLPPTLGRRGYADPLAHPGVNCLLEQLQTLRAAQPARQHYRLLLVNAFGTNLGDNLVGLSAFAHVLAALRGQLPAVSVDVLLGWHSDDSLVRMFRTVDGIDLIRTQGLTLAELARYQAVLDTEDLINLPRYGQMPLVDWYLWWFGLDPSGIAAEQKRNRLALHEPEQQWAHAALAALDGPRILINAKASVALRSMPQPAMQRLLQTLLEQWPQAQWLLIEPLPMEHPRVHHLAAAVDSVDRLHALVAAVDGLIGVDSYSQHLADAAATPAVTLFSSMPSELYPYYPLGAAVLLPGAHQLPAWGQPKVSPQAWASMAASYEAAWAALDFHQVLLALRAVMARKSASPAAYPARLRPPRPAQSDCLTRVERVGDDLLELPLRQRPEPLAQVLHDTLLQLAAQLLCPGDKVLQLAPGAGALTLALARRVGPQGCVLAIEPRWPLHQLLCANLVRSGIWHVQTHCALPEGEAPGWRPIHALQLTDEFEPLALSNSLQAQSVLCWPLDTLALDACRLLLISSPLARVPVLQGARSLLQRVRPVVLLGLVELRELSAFEACFAGLDYLLRVSPLHQPGKPEQPARHGILVAEPNGAALLQR